VKVRRKWRLAQLFEFRWWQFYLRKKNPKDYLAWKKKYWLDFLAKLNLDINSFSGKRKLDAGCGPAGIFIVMENSLVTAIDPLLSKYQDSLSHFNKKDYPAVQFKQDCIETYCQPDYYDFIFSLNAINHVFDLEIAIGNLKNSLKKEEGLLVISTDIHKNEFSKLLFRLVPGDVLHPQQHSFNDYQKLFEKLGLSMLGSTCIKKGNIFDYYAFVLKRT
jgi:2-polyprenyl-6-hydroxyphenyl methylase/3-demethylubiquinone-9 3-methyltransferase